MHARRTANTAASADPREPGAFLADGACILANQSRAYSTMDVPLYAYAMDVIMYLPVPLVCRVAASRIFTRPL